MILSVCIRPWREVISCVQIWRLYTAWGIWDVLPTFLIQSCLGLIVFIFPTSILTVLHLPCGFLLSQTPCWFSPYPQERDFNSNPDHMGNSANAKQMFNIQKKTIRMMADTKRKVSWVKHWCSWGFCHLPENTSVSNIICCEHRKLWTEWGICTIGQDITLMCQVPNPVSIRKGFAGIELLSNLPTIKSLS
jgi:hypothetical protein